MNITDLWEAGVASASCSQLVLDLPLSPRTTLEPAPQVPASAESCRADLFFLRAPSLPLLCIGCDVAAAHVMLFS